MTSMVAMRMRQSQLASCSFQQQPAAPPRHAPQHLRPQAAVLARLPALRPASCARRRVRSIPRAEAASSSSKAAKPSLGQRVRGLVQLLPSAKCVSVLQQVAQLLRTHLWAVVTIYAVKDALQFLLHRLTHRLTNYAAEVIFKYPISDEVINAWWLVLDQEFLQQYPGYQVVMGVLFLVAMPLNLLLSATASASTVLLCSPSPEQPTPSSTPTTSDPPSDPPARASGESDASSSKAGGVPPGTRAEGAVVAAGTSEGGSAAAASASAGAPAAVGPSTSSSTSEADSPSSSTPAAAGTAGSVTATSTSGSAITEATPIAAAATTSSSSSSSSSSEEARAAAVPTEKPKNGWFAPLRRGWQAAAAPLPQVRGMLRRVWWTESVVSVIGLALQAGMMLVVTVPWLLPIYLSAQLAGVTSVKLGDSGLKAIDSSAELMKGRKRVVFWPLLALILAARLVDQVKVAAFAAMPQRFWAEAVEVPLAAYVALQALRIIVSRMQDLLPVGLYLHLLQEQAADRQHKAAEEAPAAPAAAST